MKAFNKKNLLFSAAIIALLFIMGFSLQLLLGNIYFYQGQRLVQEANNYESLAKQQTHISKAINFLNKAIGFDEQADYLELKASLLIWQARQDKPVNLTNIHAAITLYQQALKQRPSWPYAWLGMVEAKIIAKQFDSTLTQAITQTAKFGFYEAMVQKQLLQLTLPNYRLLALESRRSVFAIYQQALKANNQSAKMIALGQEPGIFALFCVLNKAQLHQYTSNINLACQALFETKKGS